MVPRWEGVLTPDCMEERGTLPERRRERSRPAEVGRFNVFSRRNPMSMLTKFFCITLFIPSLLYSQALRHPFSVNSRGGGRSTGGALVLQSSIGLNAVTKLTATTITLESGYASALRAYTASTKVITGLKYNDLNGNGKQEPADTVMSGWKIYLWNSSNTIIDSAFTNSYGYFSFMNVADGQYYVSEVPVNGWYQTHPSGGNKYFVVMSNGTTKPGVDFGNINGYVYVGGNGGAWSNAGNWSGNRPPGPDDAAIVPENKTIVVDTLGEDSIKVLVVRPGGSLTFSIGVRPLRVRGAVNNDSSGTLTLPNDSTTGLICYSDFINRGTFNAGKSKIRLRGNNPKVIISDPQVSGGFIAQDKTGYPESQPRTASLPEGNGTTFYDLSIEGGVVSSTGNINIESALILEQSLTQGSEDTIRILNSSDTALAGDGVISSGTISRIIAAGSSAEYRFESGGSFIKFVNVGGCAGELFVTSLPGIDPTTYGGLWKVVPGSTDTASHTVFADSVSGFSKWAFGRPRPTFGVPGVNRLYAIDFPGCTNFLAQVQLRYDPAEVLPDVPLDSLVLLRSVLEVMDGWNMVSVPVSVSDYAKSVVYPTASGEAFSFQGTYVSQSTLANGVGYWLKFSGDGTPAMSGDPILSQTVTVGTRWNMIGSISNPVSTTTITSLPPGIVTSDFLGFNGSYYTTSVIEPGKAYWVKVSQSGQLFLSSSGNPVAGSGRIRIVPTGELPPPPPGDDAAITTDDQAKPTMPVSFALLQNFPNPFNPVTEIHYDLPSESRVTLRVYNLLGQLVTTLVDEIQVAGFKTAIWNARDLASGVYYYQFDASSTSDVGQTYREVKRMVLIK